MQSMQNLNVNDMTLKLMQSTRSVYAIHMVTFVHDDSRDIPANNQEIRNSDSEKSIQVIEVDDNIDNKSGRHVQHPILYEIILYEIPHCTDIAIYDTGIRPRT